MLYSCLVDADFLDTESFMKNGRTLREAGEAISVLLERLKDYVADWLQNEDTDTVTEEGQKYSGTVSKKESAKEVYSSLLYRQAAGKQSRLWRLRCSTLWRIVWIV